MQYMCGNGRANGGGKKDVVQIFGGGIGDYEDLNQVGGYIPLSAESKKKEQLNPTHNEALLLDANPTEILEKSSTPICGGGGGSGKGLKKVTATCCNSGSGSGGSSSGGAHKKTACCNDHDSANKRPKTAQQQLDHFFNYT
jgi:hypothetical protein